VSPSAPKSELSPFASPKPETRPIAEASSPITNDSSTTERSTCRREAPSVRSVASSRVRCATVIESVLKITNAPTKSAIPPKPSRKPRMKLMKLATPFLSSFACCLPVRTCAVCGSSRLSSETSVPEETPGFAATEMTE
jgi:hypothetical protein